MGIMVINPISWDITFMYIYILFYLFTYLFIYLFIYLHIYLYIYIFIYIHIFIYLIYITPLSMVAYGGVSKKKGTYPHIIQSSWMTMT